MKKSEKFCENAPQKILNRKRKRTDYFRNTNNYQPHYQKQSRQFQNNNPIMPRNYNINNINNNNNYDRQNRDDNQVNNNYFPKYTFQKRVRTNLKNDN